jgi:transposase
MDIAKLHLHWGERRYKGKTYRSYSLARAYRDKGKSRKEIVLKLGKLTESELQRWRDILQAAKHPQAFLTTLEQLVVTQRYAYLDVAAVNAIWDALNLNSAFPHTGKRRLALGLIARILTLNRCIDPVAKSKTPDWFRRTALPWLLQIPVERVNASRIFRELVAIEQHKEALCQHLFSYFWRRYPDAMRTVFYDLSSTTFSGSHCLLMKWGYCKEGYHNHVVLALVVNRLGLPFYWEVLPGKTPDVTTITWLLERLKQRFQDLKVTLTVDRGMVSDNNLRLLEEAEIKYISAMDKDQIEGLTGIDFSPFSHLDPKQIEQQVQSLPDFTKLTATIYYREAGVSGARRYILCLSPHLFKEQRRARAEAVMAFQHVVQELNAELRTAQKSRQHDATLKKFSQHLQKAKLKDFVHVSLEPLQIPVKTANTTRLVRTWQATVDIDDSVMRHAGRLDGFWLLVTNHTEHQHEYWPAQELIAPYQEKTVIEAAFRDIKSFIEIRPVYVWTEAHVKAHYTICVLAYLINRTLTLRLHSSPGTDISEHIVSHERLYQELSACQIDCIEVNNVQLSTYNMTRPNRVQQELLERIELPHLLHQEVFDSVIERANNNMSSNKKIENDCIPGV